MGSTCSDFLGITPGSMIQSIIIEISPARGQHAPICCNRLNLLFTNVEKNRISAKNKTRKTSLLGSQHPPECQVLFH